ncbi:hypothetical protein OTU49_008567, partial [Cherax quadricarinatus]
PKGKHEGIKRNKENRSNEVVNVEKEQEVTRGTTRGLSAGSNTSKDEGISSNTEKDEDFEAEGESEVKTDNKRVDDVDDDEGRGSINGEEELMEPGHHLSDTETNNVAGNNDEKDPETINADPQVDNVEAAGESKAEEDNAGYHGDMYEPNSLAASFQDSLEQSNSLLLSSTVNSSVEEETGAAEEPAEASSNEPVEEEVLNEAQDDSAGGKLDDSQEVADTGTSSEDRETNVQDANEEVTKESEEQEATKEVDAAENADAETPIQDEAEEPTQDAETEEPTQDAETEELTQDAETEEPTQDGETEEPTQDGEAEEPTQDGEAEEPTQDGEAEGLMQDAAESVDEIGGAPVEEQTVEGTSGNDEDEATEETDAAVVANETENNEVTADSQTDTATADAREENLNEPKESQKEEEEEIKEVAAIANLPGSYKGKRKIAPRTMKREPDVQKIQRTKQPDKNKVILNRKPISWRPTPVLASTRPEVPKPKKNILPNTKFKAKRLVKKTGEEPVINIEEYHSGSTPGDALNLPPVNISAAGDLEVPPALNTFRSEGHHDESSVDDTSTIVTKAESMPEIRYQDLTRPNTAGKKNKVAKRKKGVSKIAPIFNRTNISANAPPGGSTSEVWVPEEEKLYIYSYSSQPRLLHVRRMGAGRVATTHQWDQDPNSSFRLKLRGNGNPMYDRRVVRGSNYAKRLSNDDLPKWNPYFTNARSLEQHEMMEPEMQHHHQRRQEFREKLEARVRHRREHPGMSSLYSSHGGSHRSFQRSHVYVQTDNYYEPLERPPEVQTEAQTPDTWSQDVPMAPMSFITPRGVDAHTQVYQTELEAEDEEEVVLAALVSRTLKESVLEVLQEEQAEEDTLTRLQTAALTPHLQSADTNDGDAQDAS